MKTQFLSVLFLGVVAFNQVPVKDVLSVYTADKQTESSSDNGWIHEFETVQVGSEMEHLNSLKSSDKQLVAND